MIIEHGEGTILVALLEPADRLVGNHVGDVAGLDFLLAVLDEQRRVVFALRHQNAPEVEALWLGVQVPLADHGCLVAGVVQQLGKVCCEPSKVRELSVKPFLWLYLPVRMQAREGPEMALAT